MIFFPDSVFQMKEYLSQNIDYFVHEEEPRQTVSISFEPCLTPYLDFKMIETVATDNIPDKNFVIQSLYEWFTTIIRQDAIISIHTPKGFRSFAENGTISYFPSEYAAPFSLDERIKILNDCIDKTDEFHSFYLLDENKMVLPANLRIELSPANSLVIYGTFDDDNFSYTGEYLIVFLNNIMFSDFNNLKDYILRNHLVLNDQYTNLFLKDLILKLKTSDND